MVGAANNFESRPDSGMLTQGGNAIDAGVAATRRGSDRAVPL
jgi:gamma-glutamyltranspeptidase